jgi:hypothetical protein
MEPFLRVRMVAGNLVGIHFNDFENDEPNQVPTRVLGLTYL